MNTFLLYAISFVLLLSSGIVIFRFLVPRDYRTRGRLSPIITFLQALLFFVYGGFPYIYLPENWPATEVSGYLYYVGLFLLLAGLVLLLYGMVQLGILRSLGRGSPELNQSGIYKTSRNPQAIACGFYVIGFLILWPSWYAVGWVLLYLVLIQMMVLAEETHLRNVHGEAYREYCTQVPRYFRV